mgnify:CR=1 FL=1
MDGVITRLQLFKLQLQPPQLLLAAVLTGRQKLSTTRVRLDMIDFLSSVTALTERRRRSMATSSRICRPTLHPMTFPAPSVRRRPSLVAVKQHQR